VEGLLARVAGVVFAAGVAGDGEEVAAGGGGTDGLVGDDGAVEGFGGELFGEGGVAGPGEETAVDGGSVLGVEFAHRHLTDYYPTGGGLLRGIVRESGNSAGRVGDGRAAADAFG